MAEPLVKSEKGSRMVDSKPIAAIISLFLPGVGLILYDKKKMIEGAVVFLIALIADIVVLAISLLGGPALGVATQGMCCFLTPFFMLGLLAIPVVHILGAIHTYLRC